MVKKSGYAVLSVALAIGLLAGCSSFKPDKFNGQVKKWAPIGTPLAKAQRTLERHGFECVLVEKANPFNIEGTDILDCEKPDVWFHTWKAEIWMKDGKVSGYGETSVISGD